MRLIESSRYIKFLFYVLLVTLSSCSSVGEQNIQEVIEYHENGNISKRYYLLDGKKEGEYLEYFLNGDPELAFHFRNDKQEGKSILYYPGGVIREIQYYKNGLRNGGDTVFHQSGGIQMTLEFIDGKKDGHLQIWDTTGVMVFRASYSNDSLVEIKNRQVMPLEK